MKLTPLLHYLSVLPAMMLLTSVAQAGTTQEPQRIFDLESGNFIDNPDYREPAAEVRAAHTNPPYHEPRRIYDLEKKEFVNNPDYHEPASSHVSSPQRPANYEPRRMYDAETGQFVSNPDYREVQAAPATTTRVATTEHVHRTTLPTAHKVVIAHHHQATMPNHSHA